MQFFRSVNLTCMHSLSNAYAEHITCNYSRSRVLDRLELLKRKLVQKLFTTTGFYSNWLLLDIVNESAEIDHRRV